MDFDPEKLRQTFVEQGNSWVDLNAAADTLEKHKDSLLSQIALKYLPDAGSAAKSEMLALATVEYCDHIKEMVEARKKANRAKVLFDGTKVYIDLIRSKQATERAEIQLR